MYLHILVHCAGSSNPEVPYPIIFRGAVFADSGRFDSCTRLWLHALSLRQDTGVSVAKDLLRFAQVRPLVYCELPLLSKILTF